MRRSIRVFATANNVIDEVLDHGTHFEVVEAFTLSEFELVGLVSLEFETFEGFVELGHDIGV